MSEKKVVRVIEGYRPDRELGHRPSSETTPRKPPQGGSGTAPCQGGTNQGQSTTNQNQNKEKK